MRGGSAMYALVKHPCSLLLWNKPSHAPDDCALAAAVRTQLSPEWLLRGLPGRTRSWLQRPQVMYDRLRRLRGFSQGLPNDL